MTHRPHKIQLRDGQGACQAGWEKVTSAEYIGHDAFAAQLQRDILQLSECVTGSGGWSHSENYLLWSEGRSLHSIVC